MTRKTMRDAVIVELQETSELTDAEVDRAMDQAIHELSRFVPEEAVLEIIIDKTITGESFTSDHGVAVSLASSPIIFASERVTNSGATITYARTIDYTMDYLNGTITTLASGSMVDATSHLVNYTRDYRLINVSGLLTNPRRIIRVEGVSAGRLQSISTDVFGNFIELLTSSDGGSQAAPGDSQHLRIFYLAERELGPLDADSMSGLHQEYLEEMVIRGTSGFVMRMIARDNQSVLDLTILTNITDDSGNRLGQAVAQTNALDAANVALDGIGAILAAIRGSAGEPYDDALTALDKVATNLDIGSRAADDALLEVDTELATALTTLQAIRGTATEPFDEGIAALLLMNVQTVTNGSATAGKISDEIDGASDSIDAELDNIVSDLVAIRDETAQVLDHMETDAENANKYLADGDAFLNTINTGGPGVPANFVAFAQAKVAMATAFVANASQEVGAANVRLGATQMRVNLVNMRVQEVATRMSITSALAVEANAYNDLSLMLIKESETHIAMALAHTQEAARWQESAGIYIAEARGRIEAAQIIIAEAGTTIAQASGYVEESNARIAIDKITQDAMDANIRVIAVGLQLVDSQNRDADIRLGEFRNMIRDFAESHTQPSHIAARGQWKA